ncbi:MAG: GDP-mannose 4,6-dehydratase [Thermodesulfobium sp.]
MPIEPYRRDQGKKTALITGVTGQDGSYLVEFLLSLDYEVHAIIRRSSTFNTQRIDHIYHDPHESSANFFFYDADLTSNEYISDLIYKIRPDEVYNLGAQSHVRVSFDIPEYTSNVNALGTTRILQSIYRSGNKTKYYQASTSELYGNSPPPQNELSPFDPRSPYSVSKVYSFYMTKVFREAYNMFCSNGILFNHESPRRGETFVTRKITLAIANILSEKQNSLFMGNLESKRDWGYAPEYVEIMWKILQYNHSLDIVIGTGETHTVREFLDNAFSYVDLDWGKYVKTDPLYSRPSEVDVLLADTTKARNILNWSPKVKFKDLVKIMMDADLRKAGLESPGEGDEFLRKTFKNRWWGVD